jgi:hypothetical protein
MEEKSGTSARRTVAMKKFSQNSVMEVFNSQCIFTSFNGLEALPQLSILEELLSLDGFFKKCATIPHFLVHILFTVEAEFT